MSKILIVEENDQDRGNFVNCFKKADFTVMSATDGRLALQLAREWMPDLILSETSTPQLDGYDLLREIRKDAVTEIVPFIFLSARSSRHDVRRAMHLGADDYLFKPCAASELLAAVTARLHKQSVLMRLIDPAKLSTALACQYLPATFPRLQAVIRYIENHYRESISLREVAQAAGYSPAYLTDMVHRLTGRTVNCWITEFRMREARCLLLNSESSVQQIAFAVGYKDTCYFIRKFRQMHNTSPHAWRGGRLTERSAAHFSENSTAISG